MAKKYGMLKNITNAHHAVPKGRKVKQNRKGENQLVGGVVEVVENSAVSGK
jgi:hypothetical protein